MYMSTFYPLILTYHGDYLQEYQRAICTKLKHSRPKDFSVMGAIEGTCQFVHIC